VCEGAFILIHPSIIYPTIIESSSPSASTRSCTAAAAKGRYHWLLVWVCVQKRTGFEIERATTTTTTTENNKQHQWNAPKWLNYDKMVG
jgi:hypothetical protein